MLVCIAAAPVYVVVSLHVERERIPSGQSQVQPLPAPVPGGQQRHVDLGPVGRSVAVVLVEERMLADVSEKVSGSTVVLNSPEVVQVQSTIIKALSSFPEARAAVVAALRISTRSPESRRSFCALL